MLLDIFKHTSIYLQEKNYLLSIVFANQAKSKKTEFILN